MVDGNPFSSGTVINRAYGGGAVHVLPRSLARLMGGKRSIGLCPAWVPNEASLAGGGHRMGNAWFTVPGKKNKVLAICEARTGGKAAVIEACRRCMMAVSRDSLTQAAHWFAAVPLKGRYNRVHPDRLNWSPMRHKGDSVGPSSRFQARVVSSFITRELCLDQLADMAGYENHFEMLEDLHYLFQVDPGDDRWWWATELEELEDSGYDNCHMEPEYSDLLYGITRGSMTDYELDTMDQLYGPGAKPRPRSIGSDKFRSCPVRPSPAARRPYR